MFLHYNGRLLYSIEIMFCAGGGKNNCYNCSFEMEG